MKEKINYLRTLLQDYLLQLDQLEKNGENIMMDYESLVDSLNEEIRHLNYQDQIWLAEFLYIHLRYKKLKLKLWLQDH